MARVDNKALFFTTSPRTPAKMIPEIRLLHEQFSGREWTTNIQVEFIERLATSDFFEGVGSPSDKAFSARDRINRAPKALGFIDLKPHIELTDAGRCLIYGNRPQEVFLRQLLKFQLPSPYHIENKQIACTFYIRPYLEIMRLVRELEYLTFDELKIFALQLTNYQKFEEIKSEILNFRAEKNIRKGEYKKFVNAVWTDAVMTIYSEDIDKGKTKTRETSDSSLKNFIKTKKSNLRDYADACFRYLRYTELFAFIGHSIKIPTEKITEIDYILSTVERNPVFIDEAEAYKAHLFSATEPALYVDIKENIIDTLMKIGSFTKRELIDIAIDELKDLRDKILKERKEAVINAQVKEIKLYSEIIDTYNEIISDEYYDAPLMLEYNTWRAMTMLDGGNIKGNFKFDDAGQPLSTAQGNMPDIECDYDDFSLSVEVTLQSGQRQYETEGEPVARHYGQLKKKTGKETYCLFIALAINPAAFVHFYILNRTPTQYYGGKAKIIPLELEQFIKLVDNSYNYTTKPTPLNVRQLFDKIIEQGENSASESEWKERIQICVDSWLVA
ncbi:AlwI family type II restriction endonuclease [Clostridia bacterium]|nr:AlwI family type II restriction endonuclease [Clostridia bacterium]